MSTSLVKKLRCVRALVEEMTAAEIHHYADMAALFDSLGKLSQNDSTKRLADIAAYVAQDDESSFDVALQGILEELDEAIQQAEGSTRD